MKPGKPFSNQHSISCGERGRGKRKREKERERGREDPRLIRTKKGGKISTR